MHILSSQAANTSLQHVMDLSVISNLVTPLTFLFNDSLSLWHFFFLILYHSLSLFTYPSPYKVKVLPTHDASKVRASGPGLNTTGVPASLPVEFTIDAKDAGEGLLAVQITVSVLRQ